MYTSLVLHDYLQDLGVDLSDIESGSLDIEELKELLEALIPEEPTPLIEAAQLPETTGN